MQRERPKDRSLCSCPEEAAEVEAQSWYPALWWYPARAKPAAEASFRRPMEAGALRYSAHPAWPIHSLQFYLRAFQFFS